MAPARSYDSLTTTPSILQAPVLVLDNGTGSSRTLVGPVSLDEYLAGDGVTVVIDEAVEGSADGGSESRLAYGAFAG